jgi:uncharacterized protein
MPSNVNKVVAAVNNSNFELILLPTEKCNFRCTYCYEDFKIGKMERPTINGIKALLSNKATTTRSLSVNWFGGEPLLALPIVEEISNHIISLKKTYKSLSYVGLITTNGYFLRPSVFEQLVSWGIVKYQVSLDGNEDVHDSTRKMLNGGASFSKIWENLRAIHSKKMLAQEIMLRVHIMRNNIDSVKLLLKRIADELGDDDRFSILLRPVERLGGPNDAELELMSHAEEKNIVKQLADTISSQMRVANFDRNLDLENYICYAAKANSLVIRANGTIGKCTVALYDERNAVGKIQEDGKLLLDRERLVPWMRGLETLNADELACPYMSVVSQT